MKRALMAGSGLALLLVCFSAAQGPTVMRGPYLQTGTSSSIVVKWRTSTATDSRVRYGSSAASLTSTADDAAVTTEHQVTLAGGDANHFF